MEKNYTPLNIDALYPKKQEPPKEFDSLANTILLILATLTVFVIAVVLFVLIQKGNKGQSRLPLSLPIASLRVLHG